jgi:hypothetical protein
MSLGPAGTPEAAHERRVPYASRYAQELLHMLSPVSFPPVYLRTRGGGSDGNASPNMPKPTFGSWTLLVMSKASTGRSPLRHGRHQLIWPGGSAQPRIHGSPRRTSSQARATQISTMIPAKVSATYRRWPIAMMISQITLRSATTTYVLMVSPSMPYGMVTPCPPSMRVAMRPLAVPAPPTEPAHVLRLARSAARAARDWRGQTSGA